MGADDDGSDGDGDDCGCGDDGGADGVDSGSVDDAGIDGVDGDDDHRHDDNDDDDNDEHDEPRDDDGEKSFKNSHPPSPKQKVILLQSRLCVLTLIRCPFHPRFTVVARKRPRSFCQKCGWQVTPKHAYTLDPTKKSEWADYALSLIHI